MLVFSKDELKKPHAALMTTSIPIYLSFYPNISVWPEFVLCSLDCDEKYQSCSHYIRIPSLEDDGYGPSESRIKQFFDGFSKKLPFFGMLNHNCSAVVMEALFYGCAGDEDLKQLILSYRPWIFTPSGTLAFIKKFNNYLDNHHRPHQSQTPTQVLDKKIQDLQHLFEDKTLTSIQKLATISSSIQSIQIISNAIFQDRKTKLLKKSFDFYNYFIDSILQEINPYIANLIQIHPESCSTNDLISHLSQLLEQQPNSEIEDVVTIAITEHKSLLLLANTIISTFISERKAFITQLDSSLAYIPITPQYDGYRNQPLIKISNLTKGISFWQDSPCARFLSDESTNILQAELTFHAKKRER
jgi:hypothetical protein